MTSPTIAAIRDEKHAETVLAFLQNPQPTDLDQCKAELAHALSHLGRSLEIEAALLAENERLTKRIEMLETTLRMADQELQDRHVRDGYEIMECEICRAEWPIDDAPAHAPECLLERISAALNPHPRSRR